jgi:hypothetical protein
MVINFVAPREGPGCRNSTEPPGLIGVTLSIQSGDIAVFMRGVTLRSSHQPY